MNNGKLLLTKQVGKTLKLTKINESIDTLETAGEGNE